MSTPRRAEMSSCKKGLHSRPGGPTFSRECQPKFQRLSRLSPKRTLIEGAHFLARAWVNFAFDNREHHSTTFRMRPGPAVSDRPKSL